MEKQEFDVKFTSPIVPLTTSILLSAVSIKTYAVSDNAVPEKFINNSSTEKAYTGFVGGFSNQLGGTVGDVPGNRYGFEFMFNYLKDEPGKIERKFTVNAAMNDQNLSMYSLNEAYINKKMNYVELKFGRQILDWSPVDSFWGFGKLNNRQNFTGFAPGQEGLMGLNFNLHFDNGLKFNLFGSPLYVPEMNPSLEIDKSSGTITSNHAWANPPSATADVGSSTVPIFYDVDYPGINDVVWRYSAGFQFGWSGDHFSWDAFYMRKPENQPSTTVEVSYDTGDQVVTAAVDPQFYYHDLYGGNFNYKNGNYKLNISAIAIRPNSNPDTSLEAYQYTQIETIKRREDYLGLGFNQENDTLAFGLNYVARLSPFDRKDDIQAQDPRWNQAVNAYIKWAMFSSFSVFADMKYDMLTTDRLVMLRANLSVVKNMLISAGVNMIGAPVSGDSYWSTFKNNDAIYAGMKYLF